MTGTVRSMELGLVVDRPADEVFAVLADLGNDPRWRREWVEAHADGEGPVAVGSRTTLVGTPLGRRMEVVYEVIALEPNHSIAWRAVSGGLALQFSRAVDEVDGGTRVTFVYTMAGRLGGLLWPLLARIGRRQLVGDLPALREFLGASSSPD